MFEWFYTIKYDGYAEKNWWYFSDETQFEYLAILSQSMILLKINMMIVI